MGDIEGIKRTFRHYREVAYLVGEGGDITLANAALKDVYIYLVKHPELFPFYCIDCFNKLEPGSNPKGVPVRCPGCEDDSKKVWPIKKEDKDDGLDT